MFQVKIKEKKVKLERSVTPRWKFKWALSVVRVERDLCWKDKCGHPEHIGDRNTIGLARPQHLGGEGHLQQHHKFRASLGT